MKKLIFFLVLFPCILFSQKIPNVILLEKATKICYSDDSRNIYDCTKVLSNDKIFIQDNFLYIQNNIEKVKYEILAYHIDEEKNNKIISYVIDVNNLEYYVFTAYTDKGTKTIYISNKFNKEFTLYR